ncbi:hypothetical protein RI138_03030 [Streptomyces sp. C11-1]|uniref:Integral membrane protein n=1 Tax=Streptomyces durocortorensis TaxID=2811104 RepID=A0ABY9VPJ7_9ACTN|nr:hypothetical protein [Streptomyces durocortorensis]WNF25854.1 hypothetical protein RI138_03030 [Streptomyces durocortorensis]
MGAGTALRLGRTALFALVCVAVSGLGHALMSGTPLPLSVQAAALLPVGGAGWWLAARERNAPVTVAAHASGQLGLHGFLSAAGSWLPSGAGAHRMGGSHHLPGAMSHSAHDMSIGGPSDLMGVLAAFDGSLFTTGMAAAHAIAGLICGWWLWRGEVAAARLGRSLVLFVRAPLRSALRLWSATPPAPADPAPRRTCRRPGRRRDLLARHSVSRRGPPYRLRLL